MRHVDRVEQHRHEVSEAVPVSQPPEPANRGGGRLPPVPPSVRRAAAVIALCAIAAIGLQARGVLSSSAEPWAARVAGSALYDVFGVGFGVALVATLIMLALALRLRRLRRGRARAAGNPAIPGWAKAMMLFFIIAIIGSPLTYLLRNVLHGHGHPARIPRLGVPHPPPGRAAGAFYSGGPWPVVTGMVLAVVALVIAVIVVRRRRLAKLVHEEPDELDEQSALSDALSAGAAAMDEVADHRQAIIACYAAMEDSLAGAGAAPEAADTPAEILARAAASGLVRSTAAGELTGLFRRARYGSRGMSEAEREAAQDALARLRSDLAAGPAKVPQ
jgi:hypothetical protein